MPDQIPDDAKFVVETHPATEYDLTTLRAWTDGMQGYVKLEHIRMTGVLGVSDGTLRQSGHVDVAAINAIQAELDEIGYWDMTAKTNEPASEPWYRLWAWDGARTHTVERYGKRNQISRICDKCYGLVNLAELTTDPFDVA